ncbi:MAG: ABC transporter substrate-binding protein, partial [Thermoflexibacteraceae bacterium]
DLQHTITLADAPQKIVSLVPSQTEFLIDLGLQEQVVGITKFCIHPKDFWKKTTKIGGTKQFNFDKIHALAPAIIIGNKEENYEEGIKTLQKNYAVWCSDIVNLEDAYRMMQNLGAITANEEAAKQIIDTIKANFAALQTVNKPAKVLYFIWQSPYMVVGQGTFINEMLQIAGFQNVVEGNRYPVLSVATIQELAPDYIFLSSEPYPFKAKHLATFQEICPKAKTMIVDGELFSWYGSRLRHSAAYFKDLQHEIYDF